MSSSLRPRGRSPPRGPGSRRPGLGEPAAAGGTFVPSPPRAGPLQAGGWAGDSEVRSAPGPAGGSPPRTGETTETVAAHRVALLPEGRRRGTREPRETDRQRCWLKVVPEGEGQEQTAEAAVLEKPGGRTSAGPAGLRGAGPVVSEASGPLTALPLRGAGPAWRLEARGLAPGLVLVSPPPDQAWVLVPPPALLSPSAGPLGRAPSREPHRPKCTPKGAGSAARSPPPQRASPLHPGRRPAWPWRLSCRTRPCRRSSLLPVRATHRAPSSEEGGSGAVPWARGQVAGLWPLRTRLTEASACTLGSLASVMGGLTESFRCGQGMLSPSWRVHQPHQLERT